jgi:hypothetical protein
MSDNSRALTVEDHGAIADFGMRTVVTVDQAIARNKELQRFVAAVMVKDEDYGIIPGTGNKPTLFKPGAEKLCEMYGLVPTFEILDSVKDWENGFFFYEVKCILVSKHTGGVVAEGMGSCNSREKRYRNQDAYAIANTILKMAKKRAHVDTSLSATRSSGIFTQDVEDIGELDHDAPKAQKAAPARTVRTVEAEPAAATAPAAVPAPTFADLRAQYERVVTLADENDVPAETFDPSWPVEEIQAKGKRLSDAIRAKRTKAAHDKVQADALAAMGSAT